MRDALLEQSPNKGASACPEALLHGSTISKSIVIVFALVLTSVINLNEFEFCLANLR